MMVVGLRNNFRIKGAAKNVEDIGRRSKQAVRVCHI
jgi:hypothetical protein